MDKRSRKNIARGKSSRCLGQRLHLSSCTGTVTGTICWLVEGRFRGPHLAIRGSSSCIGREDSSLTGGPGRRESSGLTRSRHAWEI